MESFVDACTVPSSLATFVFRRNARRIRPGVVEQFEQSFGFVQRTLRTSIHCRFESFEFRSVDRKEVRKEWNKTQGRETPQEDKPMSVVNIIVVNLQALISDLILLTCIHPC